MLLMGAARPLLESLYFEAKSVRNSSGATTLTLGFTVPAGLPATARAFFLCGWLQNASGAGVIAFGGDTLDGADLLVAPLNPSNVSAPDVAAYHLLNPPSGANDLVLSGNTDFRSFCAGLWILDHVDPDQILEALYQANSTTSATTIAASMATEAPSYLLSLAGAQGFDMAPSGIDGGFTERADGVPPSASSVTIDIAFHMADQPAPIGKTYASTVTFAGADGRGIVQIAVKGR